jgi:hypothetical protein
MKSIDVNIDNIDAGRGRTKTEIKIFVGSGSDSIVMQGHIDA